MIYLAVSLLAMLLLTLVDREPSNTERSQERWPTKHSLS